MTLKKFNELLEESKKATFKYLSKNPETKSTIIIFWESYLMTSILDNLIKSKDKDQSSEEKHKAFKAWAETQNEIINLKYEQNYTDIVKNF